jgi:ribosomal-protein-alanine N-acetyltransferase
VPELQRLRADHEAAVLAFELANRTYFADFISDRGDEFFDQYPHQHASALAEQESGECAFHVLVAEDGAVLGRFNLYDLGHGTGVLGYRVARDVAGHGVATATVRELCRIAAEQYGLSMIRAQTTRDNVPSQRVLIKAGFTAAGPADIHGKPATWYERDLSVGAPG